MMVKCIVVQKEKMIEELEKLLCRKVNYGVKSFIKDNKECVVDTIEVDVKSMSTFDMNSLKKISEIYEVVDNVVVVEIEKMTKFFETFLPGEKIKKCDFVESNIFGQMEECLTFHIV